MKYTVKHLGNKYILKFARKAPSWLDGGIIYNFQVFENLRPRYDLIICDRELQRGDLLVPAKATVTYMEWKWHVTLSPQDRDNLIKLVLVEYSRLDRY